MSKGAGKSLKLFLRMMRHPGTPESIGRGVATGFFTALLFPGGHMAVAFLLAIPLRGARGTAALATWIINPFTIPVIWPLQCYVGSCLIGRPLSHKLIEHMLWNAVHTPSMQTLGELSKEMIASFLAGGALLGTGLALIGYFGTVFLVRRHRTRLAERKESRINRKKTEGPLECI